TVAFGSMESVKSAIDVQAGKQPSLLLTNQQLVNYFSNMNAGAPIRFAGRELDQLFSNRAYRNQESNKPKTLTNDDLGNNTATSRPDEPSEEVARHKGPDAIYGALDFATGFKIDLTIVAPSEDEAKQVSEGLNGGLTFGKAQLASAGQKDPKQAKLFQAI